MVTPRFADACGSDRFHTLPETTSSLTPNELLTELEHALELGKLESASEAPFAGRPVPLNDCLRDPRVVSMMIETLRGGEERRRDQFHALARLVTTLRTSRTSGTSS